jgi:hypothetical protein
MKRLIEAMEAVKAVFPGTTMYRLHLEMENGKMALIKFSKEDVGEATEFTLIPAGQYKGQICNHEWKETKKGGHMLALTIEITGPSHEGRKIFDNLNLDCDNEDAQKIALRSYKGICEACNAMQFYDSIFDLEEADTADYFDSLPELLYAKDIALKVGVEKSKDPQYGDKNKIQQYGVVAQVTSKPSAPAGKAKPAWAKSNA